MTLLKIPRVYRSSMKNITIRTDIMGHRKLCQLNMVQTNHELHEQ